MMDNPLSRASIAALSATSGRAFWTSSRRLPVRAVLGFIWLYQRTLSPVLPVVTLGRCACRFSPTCSHYAAEAVRTHGALAGAWLALRRLLKCTPLHPGGFDPVPAPRCVRATPARPVHVSTFA
jgi:putative membrane protein insertion efficiency factor